MKDQRSDFRLAIWLLLLVWRVELTILTQDALASHSKMGLKNEENLTPAKPSHIGNRILEIQQGFNEKYDTQNFIRKLDGQLGQLDKIDKNIKGFKDWVIKQTDKILYHMEHNTDLNTPDTLMRVLYAKRMIEVRAAMGVDPIKGTPTAIPYNVKDKETMGSPGLTSKLNSGHISNTQIQDMLGNSPLLNKIPVMEFNDDNRESIRKGLTSGLNSDLKPTLGSEFLQRRKETLEQTAEFQNSEEQGHLSNGDIIDPHTILEDDNQITNKELDRSGMVNVGLTANLRDDSIQNSQHGLTSLIKVEDDLDQTALGSGGLTTENTSKLGVPSEEQQRLRDDEMNRLEQEMEHNPIVNKEVEMLDNLETDPLTDVNKQIQDLEHSPIEDPNKQSTSGGLTNSSELETLENDSLVSKKDDVRDPSNVDNQSLEKQGGMTSTESQTLIQDPSSQNLTNSPQMEDQNKVLQKDIHPTSQESILQTQGSLTNQTPDLVDGNSKLTQKPVEEPLNNMVPDQISDTLDSGLNRPSLTHSEELDEEQAMIDQQKDLLNQKLSGNDTGLTSQKINETNIQQMQVEEIQDKNKEHEENLSNILRTPVDSFERDPSQSRQEAIDSLANKVELMDSEMDHLMKDPDLEDIEINRLVDSQEGLQELQEHLQTPKVQNDPELQKNILDYMMLAHNRKKASFQLKKDKSLKRKFGLNYTKFKEDQLMPKFNSRQNPNQKFDGIQHMHVKRLHNGEISGLKKFTVSDDIHRHLGRKKRRFFSNHLKI